MASTQELTRRIKSVKSTRKVTRAMQMVSASKMRKSQNATLASRTYSQLALELLNSLSLRGERLSERRGNLDLGLVRYGIASSQSLLAMTEGSLKATKTLVVVISSNRGQVGSFNANLFTKLRELENTVGVANIDYAIMGRKAMDIATRLGRNILADFTKLDSLPTAGQIIPLTEWAVKEFSQGKYRQVNIVYNHFVSTLSQQVRVTKILPLTENAKEPVGEQSKTEYTFEPSPLEVLEHVLPRIVESQMYQALLESDASEHSARMVMMKNATDNAGDLIADLTLTFNQLRQNKITTELSEITAGKIALEK